MARHLPPAVSWPGKGVAVQRKASQPGCAQPPPTCVHTPAPQPLGRSFHAISTAIQRSAPAAAAAGPAAQAANAAQSGPVAKSFGALVKEGTHNQGQFAVLEIVFYDDAGKAHKFLEKCEFGSFTHTEQILIKSATTWSNGLKNSNFKLMQFYTKKNPCTNCTNAMIAFKKLMIAKSISKSAPVLILSYTGALFIIQDQTKTGEVNIAEAKDARTNNDERLKADGWKINVV